MTPFELYFEGKVIQGDVLEATAGDSTFLFLHGGGKDRRRFTTIRNALCTTFGISSVAFDFINHGESSQNPEFDSLEYRTQQAKGVIDRFFDHKPLAIVASSMGGYIAMKLTALYPVDHLVLIVPAVYNRNAYTAKFRTEFTECIRRKDSWINTDAWELLEKYTGNLLLFSAENDEVVPKPIASYIFNTAICAKSRKHIEIPESGHKIIPFITAHPQYLDMLSNQIHELVTAV